MYSRDYKTLLIKKAIFLAVVFVFLFFGGKALAISCTGATWKADDFTCDVTFGDEGGSLLETCEYRIESDGVETVSWTSAGNCNEYETRTLPITILVGTGQDCYHDGENQCKLYTRATDEAENVVERSDFFNVDINPPVTSIWCNDTTCVSEYQDNVKITFTCSDGASGCDKTYYCIGTSSCIPNNEYNPSSPPYVTAEGTNYVRFYSIDNADNPETTKSQTISITVDQPPTASISLSPSDEVNVSGQANDTLLIDASGSSDDVGIAQVRFLSDETQNNVVDLGFTWTGWLPWETTQTKDWWFGTCGSKEVWVEVEDNSGQTDRANADIYVNCTPAANAGPDKNVYETETVILEGSGSDTDGSISYLWSCTGGSLSDNTVAQPTYIAPSVAADTPYTCALTVTDDDGATASDSATVNVLAYDCDTPGQTSTQGCGSGACLGDQTLTCGEDHAWIFGECETRNTDCGVCCICEDDNDPLPIYDETQDSDCSVYDCDPLDRDCRDYQDVQYCKGINDCADAAEDCTVYTDEAAGTLCYDQEGAVTGCITPSSCQGVRGECGSGIYSGTCRAADYDIACEGTVCGTKDCTGLDDYCSGNSLYTYSSCTQFCAAGTCADCDCQPVSTSCGTTDCSIYTDTCSAGSQSIVFYDYPVSCNNPCEVKTGDDQCGVCGCDPALTAYLCNSDFHNNCQLVTCGGSNYSCTYDGATWAWRTFFPAEDCTDGIDNNCDGYCDATGCGALPADPDCDAEPPVVTSFTSDRTTLNIDNPTVTFNWTATDSGGSHLKQVELWRRVVGQSWPADPITTIPASGDSDSGTFTDTPALDGDYEYGVHVLDNVDRLGVEPATIVVTVDETRPLKPTCSPVSDNYVDSVKVTCSSEEPGASIRYTTDGTSPTVSSSQYTGPLTFTITTTLTVAAWDTAGNRSDTPPDNTYNYTLVECDPPGDTVTQACGTGDCAGTQSRTCQIDGFWGDWSDCSTIGIDCGTKSGSCDDYCSSDNKLAEYDTDCLMDSTLRTCNLQCDVAGICQDCTLPDCLTPTTHCCEGLCGAECDADTDCSCPADQCVGPDWYDYPDYGACTASCACDTGTGSGQPCQPVINNNDSRCDNPPTCVVSLQETEVNVLGQANDLLHIDVSGSSDDFGIIQVRFSSDDSQDGIVQGAWTDWFDWNVSSGDWDAAQKIKEWGFDLSGNYEVWVEVKDEGGYTDQAKANVYVNSTPVSTLYRWDGTGYVPDEGESWQKADFTRYIYDYDSDGSLSSCEYYTYDNIENNVTAVGNRVPCNNGTFNSMEISLGAGQNCPSQGKEACTLAVRNIDNDGAEGGYDQATYDIDWMAPIVGTVSPLTALEGAAQTFSANVSDNVELNYCWFYVDGLNKGPMDISPVPCQAGVSCTASLDYAFPSGGVHTAYVGCADHFDAQTASYLNVTYGEPADITVTPNNPPVITAGPSYTSAPCSLPTSQSDCQLSLTVSATDADEDPLTYTWNFGDGNNSTEQNPTHHYETADTYTVTVTVSDGRGGVVTEGIIVEVTEPTLSVDLAANPAKGAETLYDVDLTATVSGTMSGTINYKFDCTDDGVWELEINNTSTNPYKAVDLCDYPSLGTYYAEVFIERGDSCGGIECTNGQSCCQIRKATVEVVEDDPPICQVGVPTLAKTNQWIDIGVGGSSDPEGSMATVKFCSDKNPANPNGQCDESWTQEYGWSTPEGDWADAASKTMKWSFSQTGSYEVWAEVKDDLNQTASCFDTITITECIPGDTKTCTSPQGCSHTLTCQPAGSWPSCPADDCSPGSTKECGTGGTQTCGDNCSWGSCVELPPTEECSFPPDISCPTCQHPECNTGTGLWECQADAAGTNCGDCRECDGAGSCVYSCSGAESSCQCFSDSCIDCSSYYDPGGPTLGYQGLCSCGALEIPAWTCEGGGCACVCWNPYPDLGGGEDPPGGYDPGGDPPPPPASPPPEEPCQREYPEVSILPSSQSATAGETLSYSVSVVNHDSLNCEASSFSLSKSCPSGWSCPLAVSSLTVSPGQSKSTSFTVTSPSPPYARGDYDISVTATNSAVPGYSSGGHATYQVGNNPPTANISCHPQGCDLAAGACTGYTWTSFCLRNNSTDPDGPSDIKNSIWTISGAAGDTSDCKAVSGNSICNWTLPSHFPAGSYTAQLYVEDQKGDSDITSPQPFTILQDIIADFDCSLTGEEDSWQDCDSLRVSEGEVIYFRDLSAASQGATLNYWEWHFNSGTPSVYYGQTPPPISFEAFDAGSGGVTLIIGDTAGRGDTAAGSSYQIRVTVPLPEWQESPPF